MSATIQEATSSTVDISKYYDAETKTIKMPNSNIDMPSQGMGYVIYKSFKEYSKNTALVDFNIKKSITYEDLLKLSVRTSIKLKNLNLKPGDIISIFSHNQIHSFAVFFSAILSGFINASLDPVLPDDDLEHLIQQAETKVYFVSEQTEERLMRILTKLGIQRTVVVFGKSEKNLMYDEFICEQEGEDDFEVYETDDLDKMCLIIFSSGTTGFPKGMVLSHRFFVYHSYFKIDFAKTIFAMSNIYWIGGIHTSLTQIRSGGTFCFSTLLNTPQIWDDVKEYKVDLMHMHPFAALELVASKPDNWDGTLTAILLVGTTVSDANFKKIKTALPNTFVCSLYGMTETLLILTPDVECSNEKMGSAGIPKNDIQYKVVDINTEENVSFNQPGELRVKSPFQITEYYKKDSSDIRDEEGFLRTGDIVYYDKDFYFYIVDRIKDIFKFKGVHINPAKYERLLETHSDIKEAILVGIPHEFEGAHIKAVIVLEKGSSLSPSDIEHFYNEKVIDVAKIKAGVKFVDELPRNTNGKILRRKILDAVMREISET